MEEPQFQCQRISHFRWVFLPCSVRGVPFPLKIFLTTLAVVDDIGGILVIAVGYTEHVDSCYLVWAAVVLFILWLGQYSHIKSKIFYLSLGTVVWYLFFNSGVHSTIAGVRLLSAFHPNRYLRQKRIQNKSAKP